MHEFPGLIQALQDEIKNEESISFLGSTQTPPIFLFTLKRSGRFLKHTFYLVLSML